MLKRTLDEQVDDFQKEIIKRDTEMARLREQVKELEKSKKSIVNRFDTRTHCI